MALCTCLFVKTNLNDHRMQEELKRRDPKKTVKFLSKKITDKRLTEEIFGGMKVCCLR